MEFLIRLIWRTRPDAYTKSWREAIAARKTEDERNRAIKALIKGLK